MWSSKMAEARWGSRHSRGSKYSRRIESFQGA